jgi:hypothetical protein
MAITSYRDLDVYQRSMKALVAIHKAEGCNSLIEEYTIICKMPYHLIENWRTLPAKPSERSGV